MPIVKCKSKNMAQFDETYAPLDSLVRHNNVNSISSCEFLDNMDVPLPTTRFDRDKLHSTTLYYIDYLQIIGVNFLFDHLHRSNHQQCVM